MGNRLGHLWTFIGPEARSAGRSGTNVRIIIHTLRTFNRAENINEIIMMVIKWVSVCSGEFFPENRRGSPYARAINAASAALILTEARVAAGVEHVA